MRVCAELTAWGGVAQLCICQHASVSRAAGRAEVRGRRMGALAALLRAQA